jgi:hypothetical protein
MAMRASPSNGSHASRMADLDECGGSTTGMSVEREPCRDWEDSVRLARLPDEVSASVTRAVTAGFATSRVAVRSVC